MKEDRVEIRYRKYIQEMAKNVYGDKEEEGSPPVHLSYFSDHFILSDNLSPTDIYIKLGLILISSDTDYNGGEFKLLSIEEFIVLERDNRLEDLGI